MEHLSRAYRLAFFLHRDTEVALSVASAAVMRLGGAAARQDKRFYYRPKVRRYRVVLDDEPLLQHMVCQESESWERRRATHGAATDDRLRWFLTHLVRTTLSRNAFYVAVAVCRLLYGYATRETLAIYDTVAQSDECRYQEGAVRVAKRRILSSLSEHFAPWVELCRGPRGEHRLKSRAPTRHELELVRTALCELTPWNTDCRIPERFDPCRDRLSALCAGEDPDRAQRIEIRRIHALLHPPCFERIVRALDLESPERRLRVPRFVGEPCIDRDDRAQRNELGSESDTVPTDVLLYGGS
ncbi:MAG: hypothetical protein V3T72_09385 [Thermoanaerobaculia bacterium]